jgi:hypothetical protein
MHSRHFPASAELHDDDPIAVGSDMLTGAGLALVCTGFAGGTALLLSALSLSLAWVYVVLALAVGIALEWIGRHFPT